uniref:Fanconi anemia core complex associated protein 20 n=1 Tax=Jaculus jaculus TaxID=51337 RepID=A0A8C5KSP2_JACJA
MEEAPRPRGRLSRRRPPPGAGSPSHHSWFLLEGSENKPWAALLRMALDSQPLPPFPAFPDQDPSPDPEPTVPPEVFTVGPKVFSWTPFPSALAFSGSSYHLFHGAGDPMWSPTRPLKEHPAPEPCGTLSTQELLPVQSPPALQSCPMCQQEFPPTLTQLDVDSHLAQCLAESTEDIVW